ncbi:hypothetical protein [Flavisolibacter nicotianae]|uniref:hypothetical protein n=1 Tax=Flavisolibacter nicotianae TaxID=2364882 RepID=UPI000EB45EA7|nr:hypothetical protein [Flavisolibacter nicotianae]
MMKNILIPSSLFILLFFCVQTLHAQNKQECFTKYKTLGDNYKLKGLYNLALQQYQAAKYCANLTQVQLAQLNALINETSQKVVRVKVIQRRY